MAENVKSLGRKFIFFPGFVILWRTRTQPIRTASQIIAHIIIKPANDIPLYQKISKKVAQLRLLGMSYLNIAKKLNISEPTAIKADRFTSACGKVTSSPSLREGTECRQSNLNNKQPKRRQQ